MMIRIIGLVVVSEVTPDTGVGGVVVVAIVTQHTLIFNGRMRSDQRIIIIVVWE